MTSATDAYHAELLRNVQRLREMEEANEKALAAGATEHWYFIWTEECPVCGKADETRIRMYVERPEAWEERHYRLEVYDWCQE